MRTQLILYFICGVMLPIGIIFSFVYKSVSTNVRGDYIQSMMKSMSFETKYVENYLDTVRDWQLTLYNNVEVMEYLDLGESDYEGNNYLENQARTLFHSHDEIKTLRLFTYHDNRLMEISQNYNFSSVIINPSALSEEIPYYEEVSTDDRYFLSPLHKGWKGKEVLTSNSRIVNSRGEDAAVLSIDFTTEVLESQFAGKDTQEEEDTLLVGGNGKLYYIGQGERRVIAAYLKSKDAECPEEGYENFEVDGRSYLICYDPLEEFPYVLYRIIANDVIDSSVRMPYVKSIQLLAVLFIVLCGMILLIAYKISEPLKKVQKEMEKMGRGNFQIRLTPSVKYKEVYEFICRFNEMAEQIETLFDETYRLQLAQNKAELNALQSQINPHFMANTLQTVQYLARKRNAYEIVDIVNNLGELMKYSLEGKSSVLLEDELRYAEKYLMIQRFRYIDKLEVQIQGDSGIGVIAVPKMILQPLIENAFIHGFDSLQEKYFIKIRYERQGGQVRISVEDNGRGMTESRIKEIMRWVEMEINMEEDAGRIGIYNVAQRLKLIYGQDFRLEVQSEPYRCTSVTICLPVRFSEEIEKKGKTERGR